MIAVVWIDLGVSLETNGKGKGKICCFWEAMEVPRNNGWHARVISVARYGCLGAADADRVGCLFVRRNISSTTTSPLDAGVSQMLNR